MNLKLNLHIAYKLFLSVSVASYNMQFVSAYCRNSICSSSFVVTFALDHDLRCFSLFLILYHFLSLSSENFICYSFFFCYSLFASCKILIVVVIWLRKLNLHKATTLFVYNSQILWSKIFSF